MKGLTPDYYRRYPLPCSTRTAVQTPLIFAAAHSHTSATAGALLWTWREGSSHS
jgi:hypothetical protein